MRKGEDVKGEDVKREDVKREDVKREDVKREDTSRFTFQLVGRPTRWYGIRWGKVKT